MPAETPSARRVKIWMTPPIASDPQRAARGPRTISTRSITEGSRISQVNAPVPLAAARTPSISTSTWLELSPRMKTLVWPPGPPLRAMSIPASSRSSSSRSGAWLRSISSLSITEARAGTEMALCSMRLAVIMMGSSSQAVSAEAGRKTETRESPAATARRVIAVFFILDSRRTPAPSCAHGRDKDEGVQRACAGHANRPVPPTAAETTLEAGLLTPSRERNFPVRRLPVQLSMHSGCLLSDLMQPGPEAECIAGYSCGGSAGLCPGGQHRLPVSFRARDKLANETPQATKSAPGIGPEAQTSIPNVNAGGSAGPEGWIWFRQRANRESGKGKAGHEELEENRPGQAGSGLRVREPNPSAMDSGLNRVTRTPRLSRPGRWLVSGPRQPTGRRAYAASVSKIP